MKSYKVDPNGNVRIRLDMDNCFLELRFRDGKAFHALMVEMNRIDRELNPDICPEAQWCAEVAKFMIDVLDAAM